MFFNLGKLDRIRTRAYCTIHYIILRQFAHCTWYKKHHHHPPPYKYESVKIFDKNVQKQERASYLTTTNQQHSNSFYTPTPTLPVSLSHPAAPLCPILRAFSHLELCRSRLATGSDPFSLGLGARSAVALTLSRVWWRSTATRRATRETWLSDAHLMHSKSAMVRGAVSKQEQYVGAEGQKKQIKCVRASDTAPKLRG